MLYIHLRNVPTMSVLLFYTSYNPQDTAPIIWIWILCVQNLDSLYLLMQARVKNQKDISLNKL